MSTNYKVVMFSGSSVSVSHPSFRVFQRENLKEGAPFAPVVKPAIAVGGVLVANSEPSADVTPLAEPLPRAARFALLPEVSADSEEDLTSWLSDQIPLDANFVDA